MHASYLDRNKLTNKKVSMSTKHWENEEYSTIRASMVLFWIEYRVRAKNSANTKKKSVKKFTHFFPRMFHDEVNQIQANSQRPVRGTALVVLNSDSTCCQHLSYRDLVAIFDSYYSNQSGLSPVKKERFSVVVVPLHFSSHCLNFFQWIYGQIYELVQNEKK